MVVLVIDLRRVPLGSPALAPLWNCRLVGHNISFDAKILAANGVRIADANLVDTILMAGLVLRGVEDMRREGSRRPSLEAAVKEALGLELPKTSQLSPWWRDQLTPEQIAYAALDAVCALKLAPALAEPISALSKGPDGKTLLGRLCAAVGPVARMELAGITLDREALAKQVSAWDEELTALKGEIAAKLGIAEPFQRVPGGDMARPRAGAARCNQDNEFGVGLAAHTGRVSINQGQAPATAHRPSTGRRPARAVLTA